MKVNHDGVDGRFKLQFPSQIMLDMSVREPDNKNENCIILLVLLKYQIQNCRSKYTEMSMLFKKYAKMGVSTIPIVNSLL